MNLRPRRTKETNPPNASAATATPSNTVGPPAKRRATARTRSTTTRGSPSTLHRLPGELFDNICQMLHPRDLLALARTAKFLRRVIMNRHFAAVWAASLANVEAWGTQPFPPCAPGLTPPQYASMVFGIFCNHCGGKGKTVHWSLGVRLCEFCTRWQLVSATRCIEDLGFAGTLPSDILLILRKLVRRVTYDSYLLDFTYRPHAQAVMSEWLALDDAGRKRFLVERREMLHAAKDHAQQCVLWQQQTRVKVYNDRKVLCKIRSDAVIERLRALGWGKELDYNSSAILRHPSVNKPHPLSDRIWEYMEQEMLVTMEKVRYQMHCEEVRETIQERRWRLDAFLQERCARLEPMMYALPRAEDVERCEFFPDLKTLLEPKVKDHSRKLERLQEIALESFPSAVANWRHSLAVELYDSIPLTMGAHPSDDEKVSFLSLATTSFACNEDSEDRTREGLIRAAIFRGGKKSHFPYVLAHYCDSDVAPAGCLRYNEELASLIADLVRLAGLDPATATCRAMDAVDARFMCRGCCAAEDVPRVYAMSWWDCVAHYVQVHEPNYEGPQDMEWERLTPDEEERVRKLAPCEVLAGDEAWRCLLCERGKRTVCSAMDDMEDHVREKHNVEEDDLVFGEHIAREDVYPTSGDPKPIDMRIVDGIAPMHEPYRSLR